MGVIVRQKVKGKGKPWWVFVAHNGKRTSRMVGDKSAAETVASKIRAKLQLGEFGFKKENQAPIFGEYAQSWIATLVPAECKRATAQSYRELLKNHVLPEFENSGITEIKKGKVREFLARKINEGYSASTVGHLRNVLSGVLNKAIEDEIIEINPALGIKKKLFKNGLKNDSEDADPLTREEAKLLLDTTRADPRLQEHYPLFLLLVRTGMRMGEALGLQWGDIDWNERVIHVRRNLSKMHIETPKSGKGRPVDMSRQLAAVLKAYRIKCKAKGVALGLGNAPEYVFTNERGGFIDINNWRRRVFHKALEKVGLRRIRIHDLRHTYATLRISKGDNIADVSNQLGHYSVKLTLDVYYKWLPGKKKSEVDELDDSEFSENDVPECTLYAPKAEKELDGTA